MHRFFVSPETLRSDRVTLTGSQARQIATVLRLRAGEEIALVADGSEAVVALESVRPTSITGVVRERGFTPAEPTLALTLAGVSRIVPFTSARSVVRSLSEAKRARWERIAREAAETARRGRVPSIEPASSWIDLFAALPAPIFVAWESERRMRLRDALPETARALSIVIGPEGGIADDEIAQARGRRAVTVTLGDRNLRSETAAIAAVALVMDRLS